MKLNFLTFLIAAAPYVYALPKITRVGKYLYDDTGKRFFIKVGYHLMPFIFCNERPFILFYFFGAEGTQFLVTISTPREARQANGNLPRAVAQTSAKETSD